MPDQSAGQRYMGQEEMGVMKCWKSGKNLMILEIKRPWCEPAPVYVMEQKVVGCDGGDRSLTFGPFGQSWPTAGSAFCTMS